MYIYTFILQIFKRYSHENTYGQDATIVVNIIRILKKKRTTDGRSIHAGQSFLERVMTKATYTCFDVNFAIEYLEKILIDVVPTSRLTQFILPRFENFRVVYREGNVITIIPKGARYV